MSRTVNKYHFQCTDCDTIYQQDEVKYLCPVCSAENTNISPPKGENSCPASHQRDADNIYDWSFICHGADTADAGAFHQHRL